MCILFVAVHAFRCFLCLQSFCFGFGFARGRGYLLRFCRHLSEKDDNFGFSSDVKHSPHEYAYIKLRNEKGAIKLLEIYYRLLEIIIITIEFENLNYWG